MNLRLKINLNTLLPLTIGVLLVVCIGIVPIFIYYPDFIDEIIDDMTEDQKAVLQTIVNQQAYTVSHLYYPSIEVVLLLADQFEKYYANSLKIKETFTGEGIDVNLVRLTLGLEVPAYFNQSTNSSSLASTWYDGNYNTTKEQLDEATQQNLYDAEVMHFIIQSYSALGQESKFEIGFDYDGLFIISPAEPLPGFLNYSLPNCSYLEGNSSYYEPRCREWYTTTKNTLTKEAVTLSDPYVFAGFNFIGVNACKGIWVNGPLELIECIGYTIDLLTEFFDQQDFSSYKYSLNNNLKVILHPDLNSEQQNSNITIEDLEFTDNIQSEIEDFDRNVLPLFKDGKQHIFEYMKNDEEM